jgi:hypothetical protein
MAVTGIASRARLRGGRADDQHADGGESGEEKGRDALHDGPPGAG